MPKLEIETDFGGPYFLLIYYTIVNVEQEDSSTLFHEIKRGDRCCVYRVYRWYKVDLSQ